LQNIVAVFLAS